MELEEPKRYILEVQNSTIGQKAETITVEAEDDGKGES